MNRATQNLENDHIYILKLTEVMLEMAQRPEPDPVYIDEVVDIIRNFADGLHHAKEENMLFPMLVDKGIPAENGPVGVMLHEHVQGRNFVAEMALGSIDWREGRKDAAARINQALQGYAILLQNHIAKENNILFRMADNLMSAQEEEKMYHNFVKVDSGDLSGPASPDYVKRINLLAELYLTQ